MHLSIHRAHHTALCSLNTYVHSKEWGGRGTCCSYIYTVYTPVCNNSGEFTRLSSAAESQLAGDPLAGRTVCVCEKYAASMALHTNVGLGDFVLMDKIDMVQFVKNLKIR